MKLQSLSSFLLLGLVLSLVGFFFVFRSEQNVLSGKEIARLEVVSGSFQLFRNQNKISLTRQKLNKVIPLFSLDRIESSPGSQGLLKTSRGDVFRLFDSQAFTLDEQNEEIRIILHHGELTLDQRSEEDQTFIVLNGEMLSLDQYFLRDLTSLTPPSPNNHHLPQENKNQSKETLSPRSPISISRDQLRELIQKNRQQFFKCYSSLLQKEPKAQGEVRATLRILKNGKVTQPSIVQSFTENQEFKNCLVQVLSRTDVPAFEGEQITTIIPLLFE
jgi:hypothetical protein